jgi:hypothetical protein
MDYGKLLRRAWEITWNNKFLWILGFLAGLGSGSGPNFNLNRFSGGGPSFEGDFPEGFGPGPGGPPIPPDMMDSAVPIVLAVLCVLFLVWIVFWVIGTIANGGLIGGVNQIETEDSSSFGRGWSAAAPKMWRLLGISLATAIPGLIVLVSGVILALPALGLMAAGAEDAGGAALVGALVCLAPLACIAALAGLVLGIFKTFADRAAMLEDESVIEAYKRGWNILIPNIGPAILIFLIQVVIGFVVGLIVAIPFAIAGVLVFGGGVLSAFADSGLVGAPLFIVGGCLFLVFLVIAVVVGAVQTTFFSSVWTLAYREWMTPAEEAAPAV